MTSDNRTRKAVAPKTTKKTSAVTEGLNVVRSHDSMPAQLEALGIGESIARGLRVPLDDFAQDTARLWADRMANQISVAVSRTKAANPLRDFSSERLVGLAHQSPNLLASVIVTRTK